MDLVKKLKIFHLFLLRKIVKENMFNDILERKASFCRLKNREFKQSKTCDFSENVSPLFWSKN